MHYKWHKLRLLTVAATFGSLVIVGSSISHGEGLRDSARQPGVGLTRSVGGSDLGETMPGFRNRTSSIANASAMVVGSASSAENIEPIDFSVATGPRARKINRRPRKTTLRLQTQPFAAIHVTIPTNIRATRGTRASGPEIGITEMKSNLPLGHGRASAKGKFIASIQGNLGRIDDKMPGGLYQGEMPVTVAYE